jgi:hypothetical protein
MDQAFPIELTPPDPDDIEWVARAVGHEAVGDTAEEALSALGELLDEIVEDSEYHRLHAPRIHGHPTGSEIPEDQHRHGVQLPQRERSEAPPPVHKTE